MTTTPNRLRRRERPEALITLPMIAGMLGLAAALLVACLLWTLLAAPPDGPVPGLPGSSVTLIPAPTSTPLPPPTATFDPLLGTPTPVPGAIAIGVFVQVSGTDGDPLRLRAAPGLSSQVLFFAEETDLFVVRDGPQVSGAYTWWYLVSNSDPSIVGWAAQDFLVYIPNQ